ncbi:MAG: periplasmic heavy metal sensor [Acidobacteria bacterium]|nr:periplasmic heavy metal sensor [Acidobacteriota bacterium]
MFRRTIIISSLIVALAGTATAQGPRRRAEPVRSPGQRIERLQQRLNLNEMQKNALRALEENRRREMESRREELRQKREALRSLMQQRNPNPTDVGAATLALRETRERAREINERFLAGVRGLLGPDQQQRLPKRLR